MKQNILLVCYDNDISKKVADKLADFFSMRVLNAYELFEFDFAPRNLSQMVSECGADYVKNEFAKIVKYSSDYENVILVADISMADTCKDSFNKINSDYVSVFLHDTPEAEESFLRKKNLSPELNKLFLYSAEELKVKQQVLQQNTDCSVCISGLTLMEVLFKTIAGIKSIYDMN